jgi:DNA-binding beta-propeller fold protein YncE
MLRSIFSSLLLLFSSVSLAGSIAYIPDGSKLGVVDLDTKTVTSYVPGVGAAKQVVLTPDKKFALVLSGADAQQSQISVFDTTTNQFAYLIRGFEPNTYATAADISPDQKTAYICVSSNGVHKIAIVDMNKMRVIGYLTNNESGTGAPIIKIRFSPDGKKAVFLTDDVFWQAFIIDTAAQKVVTYLQDIYDPSDFVISNDSKTVYFSEFGIASENKGDVLKAVSLDTYAVLDKRMYFGGKNVSWALLAMANDQKIYAEVQGAVYVLDPLKMQQPDSVIRFHGFGICDQGLPVISPDQKYLYLTSGDCGTPASLYTIDRKSEQVSAATIAGLDNMLDMQIL